MLTEVQLTHFKAFSQTTRVPLRALTLLFGGNSAGKSSVFHAMHLAREVLTRGNLDPDRTELGGAGLDLGGFVNLAHKHDVSKPVVLSFVLEAEEIVWETYEAVAAALAELADEQGEGENVPLAGGDGTLRELRVTLELRASSTQGQVYVAAVELGAEPDGLAAVRVERNSATELGAMMTRFDARQWRSGPEEQAMGHPALWREVESLNAAGEDPGGGVIKGFLEIPITGVTEGLGLLGGFEAWRFEEVEGDESLVQRLVPWTIGMALGALRDELKKLLHVGPVRALPERRYRVPRTPTPSRWYAGLAAWDELLDARPEFVAVVNEWLHGQSGIDARVAVGVQQVFELEPASLRDAIAKAKAQDFTALEALERDAELHRRFVATDDERKVQVAPRDLGVGMSQVIPVVVAALQGDKRLVAVEQPELHVHPRVAVGLGDLFASQVAKRKQLIVETHSEHLLLRVLRRIRETGGRPEGSEEPPVTLRPEDVSVVYFDVLESGVVNAVPLRVDRAGHFLDRWPHGFFEEQVRELVGDDGWPPPPDEEEIEEPTDAP